MNNNSLVSVLVTTFNRKELLKETIDSIINQTYKYFELIIVDNYSDYDFFSHIKSFNDVRIRSFQNANNGIIAINRNYGINKATGKYIAFCDDDDIWLPQKLEKQMKSIDNSCSKMVFTMQKQFGATSIFSNYYGIVPLPFRADATTSALLKKNCIPLSSVLIQKELLKKTGDFNENKSYIAIEDYDLWIRVSEVTKIEFIPEVLVLHRVHKLNIYENMPNINDGLRKMRNSYRNGRVLMFKEFTKQNPIYFFSRNLIYLIYEKVFNRYIYGHK